MNTAKFFVVRFGGPGQSCTHLATAIGDPGAMLCGRQANRKGLRTWEWSPEGEDGEKIHDPISLVWCGFCRRRYRAALEASS